MKVIEKIDLPDEFFDATEVDESRCVKSIRCKKSAPKLEEFGDEYELFGKERDEDLIIFPLEYKVSDNLILMSIECETMDELCQYVEQGITAYIIMHVTPDIAREMSYDFLCKETGVAFLRKFPDDFDVYEIVSIGAYIVLGQSLYTEMPAYFLPNMFKFILKDRRIRETNKVFFNLYVKKRI